MPKAKLARGTTGRVILFAGKKGTGKTSAATYMAFDEFLNGSQIFSNYKLYFEKGRDGKKRKYHWMINRKTLEYEKFYINDNVKPVIHMPFEEIVKFPEELRDGVLLLDEIQIGSDSRSFLKESTKAIGQFFQQIRKRNILCIMTTQFEDSVGKRVRQQVDNYGIIIKSYRYKKPATDEDLNVYHDLVYDPLIFDGRPYHEMSAFNIYDKDDFHAAITPYEQFMFIENEGVLPHHHVFRANETFDLYDTGEVIRADYDDDETPKKKKKKREKVEIIKKDKKKEEKISKKNAKRKFIYNQLINNGVEAKDAKLARDSYKKAKELFPKFKKPKEGELK